MPLPRMYRTAVDLCPDMADAQSQLGHLLSASGAFAEAIECFRAALQWASDNSDTLTGLANALLMLGIFDEAEAVHRRVIDLAPRVGCRLDKCWKCFSPADPGR